MEKAKNLKDLTEAEFNALKSAGLLKTIYPDAPDSHDKIKGKRPKPLESPDFSSLIKMCEEHLDKLEQEKTRDDDEHWFYEEAINIVYGKDNKIWDYINLINK